MTDVDNSREQPGDVLIAATAEAPPPEVRRGRKQLWVLAAVAAVVLVVGIVVAFLPSKGGGNGVGTRALAGTTAAPATGPGHAAPNGHLTPAKTPEEVASSIHLSVKLADHLRKWDAGAGGVALAAVTNDLGSALQAGGIKLYSPMRSACINLATAAATAEADPRIPDVAVQNRYRTALAGLARAAADCRAAISVQANGEENVQTEENPALFDRAKNELSNGTVDLYGVTEEMAAATRT